MGASGDGSLNNPYWATWVWSAWNDPRTYNLVKRYTHRPAEQLYHTAEDPFEMTNLAGNRQYEDVMAQFRAELDRWLAAQGDPGTPQDTDEAIRAARRGEHLCFPPGKPLRVRRPDPLDRQRSLVPRSAAQ